MKQITQCQQVRRSCELRTDLEAEGLGGHADFSSPHPDRGMAALLSPAARRLAHNSARSRDEETQTPAAKNSLNLYFHLYRCPVTTDEGESTSVVITCWKVDGLTVSSLKEKRTLTSEVCWIYYVKGNVG